MKTPANSAKTIAFIAICLFVFLEVFFFKFNYHPVGWGGAAILILFGVWRIATEHSFYQKARIIVIVGTFTLFWCVMPLLFNVKIPIIGGQWGSFPSIHTIGSLTFFGYMLLILLFGRRVDCGWCCPCVTARETVGYPFRDRTVRSELWWRLRWLKMLPLALLLTYLGFMIVDASSAYERAGGFYYNAVTYAYYASFLIIPLTGNRLFCRILCPFAALWGVLSVAGFYRIKAERERCTGCNACTNVCDMGVPVARLVAEKGQIRTIECMGCGRCVSACPNDVLQFHSFWAHIARVLPLRNLRKADGI